MTTHGKSRRPQKSQVHFVDTAWSPGLPAELCSGQSAPYAHERESSTRGDRRGDDKDDPESGPSVSWKSKRSGTMSASAQATPIRASNVFLDTEVFLEANFAYASPRLTSVRGLAGSDRIHVFLTTLTVREIKANIREAIQRAANTRLPPILRNSSSSRVKVLFEPLDAAEIETELFSQLDEFIKDARVTVLPIEGEVLGPVLDDYFDRLPPFGLGKNKAEFPDALVLETLKEWCRVEDRGMAVVTRDEGVRAACSDAGPLFHFEDLPRYLNAVASENDVLSTFIREMIVRQDREVFEKARIAFPYLGFYLSDQDGDVENVELTDIDYDGDIAIISLTAEQAIIEMPATLKYTADVSYSVPGTGSFDAEDRVLLYQDTAAATVTRGAHRSVAAEVTFADLDPESFEVHSVWFEGSQDISVTSDFDEGWPYK